MAQENNEREELFAAITKIDLAGAVKHLRNWMSYVDEHHRKKYADLIEAQAKLIASFVNEGTGAVAQQPSDRALVKELADVAETVLRPAIIEECAKHIEHEADVATNSLHCGDNSQTIAATHRVSRAYYEAAKSIRGLVVSSTDRGTET